MLYINERTGHIINVRVPVHGGGWRPYGAAHAAPGVSPVSQDPLAENDVQGPENGPQDDVPAAAELDTAPDATPAAPAAPGPKKPAPRPSAPKKPAAKKTAAKKPAAKRASTSSRKTK